jgi:hypothetical protein
LPEAAAAGATAAEEEAAGRPKQQMTETGTRGRSGLVKGDRLTRFDPDEECDLSMAALQGHLMTWKRDPWGAVEQVGGIGTTSSYGGKGSSSNDNAAACTSSAAVGTD